ncbi:30S ribosomal protein S3 [candidate division WOR-3 bacterium]|nr:30S ribosomal protein S3 [candidate division WOR-3 bacterium]
MGQKTHPIGFRVGVNKDWKSRWFFGKKFSGPLQEDINIRKYLNSEFKDAWIAGIEVERTAETVRVIIETARPGMVIGKGGEEVKRIRGKLNEILNKNVYLDIKECKMPELDASLVAQSVARQIERRVLQRRAMKRVVEEAIKMGAAGIRVQCKGRLGGAEIARKEWYLEGRVPLHTIKANIDYAHETANTKSGTIGVKVWINRDF